MWIALWCLFFAIYQHLNIQHNDPAVFFGPWWYRFGKKYLGSYNKNKKHGILYHSRSKHVFLPQPFFPFSALDVSHVWLSPKILIMLDNPGGRRTRRWFINCSFRVFMLKVRGENVDSVRRVPQIHISKYQTLQVINRQYWGKVRETPRVLLARIPTSSPIYNKRTCIYKL